MVVEEPKSADNLLRANSANDNPASTSTSTPDNPSLVSLSMLFGGLDDPADDDDLPPHLLALINQHKATEPASPQVSAAAAAKSKVFNETNV